ncbi:hypothetical protein IV417_00035 [Alphaproteobacteria bacterium KMM 3653]|uniref:Uncharacterized protein n=1 Tax=Harenicola maris TaxID=2841044 RepID=A0AAP2CMF1_9RHOB|nr:hypothetical protein [Harenicola maris]
MLLYKNSDLHKCHAAAVQTLSPYFDRIAPVHFTLSYTITTPEHEITLDTFMAHGEITQALGAASLGAAPDVSARPKEGLFAGLISGPAPQ